jgi:DNA-binding IclR family transcriptional regulator
MTREPFDLQKIRRNWERAAATLPVRSPDRLAGVQAPLDPYTTGAALLERLRREVFDAFPEQQRPLAPFLDRAETCFEQLRQRTADARADAPDLSELRQQLLAAFDDLEDICEAFLGLRR